MRALVFVLLAGCAAHASFATSTSEEPASESPRIANAIQRDQIVQLLGKTPDEARRLLKSFGHDGSLTIEPSKDTFYPDCQQGRICDWNVHQSGGRAYGASIHDDFTLYTQKELPATTAPPP